MVKSLLSIDPIIYSPSAKKPKFCSTCSNLATMEATFDVGDGVTTVEKYCDDCAKKVSHKL